MKKCDLCGEENLITYIDGKTCRGPWANMCPACFVELGLGIGIGFGQVYKWDKENNGYRQISGGSQEGKLFK